MAACRRRERRFSVELSAAPGARIYYTLDCSAPDETSTPYTGPISVAGTTIVRAIAYLDGYLPSYSASESYLYDADHTMRVVSMVADPDDILAPRASTRSIAKTSSAPATSRFIRGRRADALGKLRAAPARTGQPLHGPEGLQGHRPRRIRFQPLSGPPVHQAGLHGVSVLPAALLQRGWADDAHARFHPHLACAGHGRALSGNGAVRALHQRRILGPLQHARAHLRRHDLPV